MISQGRLKKEFKTIAGEQKEFIRNVELEGQQLHKWTMLILPRSPPYNKSAFKISVHFPDDYPFKPPEIKFITPIYHPNVDEKTGRPCLTILDNWKPNILISQVLQFLLVMINSPELDHPLRPDLAELLTTHPKQFRKKAEEMCNLWAIPISSLP